MLFKPLSGVFRVLFFCHSRNYSFVLLLKLLQNVAVEGILIFPVCIHGVVLDFDKLAASVPVTNPTRVAYGSCTYATHSRFRHLYSH